MVEATVRDLLQSKGSEVAWIDPGASVADVLAQLAERSVGALVVSSNGVTLEGIVSERDVVRALAAADPAVFERTVATIMTKSVKTCGLEDPVSTLMARMTTGRFRHLPVIDDDELVGVISIGDVVKQRVGELEAEAEQLLEFIRAR